MNELDEEDNPENVFKGNAVGLYIDKNRSDSKRNNNKLKPDQTEGEFIVSGYSTQLFNKIPAIRILPVRNK